MPAAINVTGHSSSAGPARGLDLLTLKEAAALLRVCVKTIRRLIKKHKIPVLLVGNRILVPVEHLSLFMTKKW